jgi:hypothetical protein
MSPEEKYKFILDSSDPKLLQAFFDVLGAPLDSGGFSKKTRTPYRL